LILSARSAVKYLFLLLFSLGGLGGLGGSIIEFDSSASLRLCG
jgi:hypothetical protein